MTLAFPPSRALLLGVLFLAPAARGAIAQDGSWNGGAGPSFTNPANWTPAGVPSGVASFGASAETAPQINASPTLGTLQFLSGAPAYTIGINPPGGGFTNLTLNGAGIVNASGATQTFSLNGLNGNNYAGLIAAGAASLGDARIISTGFGRVALMGTATAGAASLAGIPLITLDGNATLAQATVSNAGAIMAGFAGSGSAPSLGSASISLASGGTLRLAGNATLGDARITLGGGGSYLQVFDGVTGGSAQLTMAPGSAFLLGNGSSPVAGFTLAALAGTGGTVELNANDLTIGRVVGGTFDGVIQGRGSVTFAGAGTTVLTGQNTYTGRTVVQGGTLQIGNGGTTGAINGNVVLPASGNALVFARTDGITYGGEISGAGSVRIASGGVTFIGENTYTGGTLIDAGAGLRLGCGCGTGSILGNVTNNGVLVFNRGDNSTFPGAVSGAGSLRVSYGGVTLTGANTYTGGTTVETDGALRLGNGGTTGSITGPVANYGTLAFNRSDAITVTNPILGDGFVQVLSGSVTLPTVQFYTGPTLVQGGTLVVNGAIAASAQLSVGNGAAVAGTGLLPTTIVSRGGTIAPGQAGVGMLTVLGNLTLRSGATAAIDVGGAAADRINVSGRAQLDGTLRIAPAGTKFGFGTAYTLVSAAGGVAGQFAATQSGFGVRVNPVVTYTGSSVQLMLSAAPLAPGGGPALPANQQAAAAALDAAVSAGRDVSAFFNVYNQPAATIGAAVNQLSGEVSTSVIGMGLAAGEQFLGAMLDPLGYGRESLLGGRLRTPSGDGADGPAEARRYAVWGTAMGGYNRTSGDAASGAATRSTRTAGFSLGLDVLVGRESLTGIAVAAGESNASLSGGLGSARSTMGQIGAYGSTRLGSFTLAGAGAVSLLDITTKRTLYFVDGSQLRGGTDGQVYSLRGEIRQDGQVWAGFRIQPVAALQWQMVRSAGYQEQNFTPGGTPGLNVARSDNATSRTELGLAAQGEFEVAGRAVAGFARVAWGHYLQRDQRIGVGFAGLPEGGFSVLGARPDADSALVSAGLETQIAPGLTLGARLDSEFSGNVRQVAGTARLRYSF